MEEPAPDNSSGVEQGHCPRSACLPTTGHEDSNGWQTRASHDTYDMDVDPQELHFALEDDVAGDRPRHDGGVKELLGNEMCPTSMYPSVLDQALAPYQRSTSYPVRDNALQLRVSVNSSSSDFCTKDPTYGANRRLPMEGSPTSSSSSPSPMSTVSTPPRASDSRASSLDSSTQRVRIVNGRDDHEHDVREAADKQSNGKAARPSLSGLRVRFRSRVRIGSGIRHSKHECTVDCSPSSSISAPLRESADSNDEHMFWQQATTSTAVSAPPGGQVELIDDMFGLDGAGMSSSSGLRGQRYHRPKRARRLTGTYPFATNNSIPASDERTPLISSLRPQCYPQSHSTSSEHAAKNRTRRRVYLSDIADSEEDLQAREGEEGDEDRARRHSLEQNARRRDEELEFGRWPWRLVNGYWWWWKCEPVLCCCYASDSDSDDLD